MRTRFLKPILACSLILAASSAGARTTPLRGTPPERLLELASRSPRITVLVGVRVDGGWSAAATRIPHKDAQQRKKAKETKERILRAHPTVRRVADRDYEFIPGFVLEVDGFALRRLLEDDDVTSIQENERAVRALKQSTAIIGSSVAKSNGFDGAGQTIAVIDDGVASGHPFFGGRVLYAEGACFSGTDGFNQTLCTHGQTTEVAAGAGEPCPAAYDCSHGTQVAGIAAGNHPADATFFGVAPGATILPIQVYSRLVNGATEANLSDILQALMHVIDRRNQHSFTVNLSLRWRTNYSSRTACIDANPLLDQAVSTLSANGVAVIAAIGNKNGSSEPNQVVAPACLTDAISVGATTDNDEIAVYSYVQPYMDFFAPGGKTDTSFHMAPGEGIETSTTGNAYLESVGTSFAAPHVAGAFAVLRQASPAATVSRLEADLKATGTAVTISAGAQVPRINVNAARLADRVPPTTPGAFSATGSSGAVSLSWTDSTDSGSGVDHYEVSRRAMRTADFEVLEEVTGTNFTDSYAISPSRMYEYRIVAVDTYGKRSNPATNFAVTVTFTDDLTAFEQRVITGVHVAQLRAAVDGWREFALLPRLNASYPPATGVVAATHFTTIVDALNAARHEVSLPDFVYSGVSAPALTQLVRKEHVLQLRDSMQ